MAKKGDSQMAIDTAGMLSCSCCFAMNASARLVDDVVVRLVLENEYR